MTTPAPPSARLLVRLWRGQLGLVPHFWLLGVLARSVLWIATYLLLFRYASAFLWADFGYLFLIGWCVALLPAEFVVSVAIWRSASRYQGRKVLGRLAKYGVVAMTLMAVSNNYIFIARLKNLSLTRQEIGALNGALPVIASDGTRLDSVVARGGVIIFNYTILGSAAGGRIDRDAATRETRCKPENLSLLDAFRASSSVYKNEAGEIVAVHTVSRSDCRQP